MNLKNKGGFSLLEMTIAMSLAVGLLLFYMKMQTEQAKKTLTSRVSQEIETFFNDFKGTLNRPGFCNKSFENIVLSDNSSTTIATIKNPRGDIRYKTGEVYGNKTLKLNSITLKNFKPDDFEGLEGIATLELDIDKLGNVYGSKKIFKTMEVSVSRDQAKKIIACGSLASGGVNINLTVPSTTTTPVSNIDSTSSTTTNPTSTQSTSPSQISPSSPSPSEATSGQFNIENNKAMMNEIEKNPELKKIHESIKQMQQDNNEDLEQNDL